MTNWISVLPKFVMRHLETGPRLSSILCITKNFNFVDFNPEPSIDLFSGAAGDEDFADHEGVCVANMNRSGGMQGLSCLSGMTVEFLTRAQEDSLLLVMQKRSLSCGKRNTTPGKYFSCLAVHYRALTIRISASHVSRPPRHICN